MTRILPTIGPISCSLSSIKKFSSLTKLIRINGSHNTINWHEKISSKIKSVNKDTTVLFDIPGIKPRTLNNNIVLIKKNNLCCFYFKKKPLLKNISHFIELSNPLPKLKRNKYFSLSDGSFQFLTKKIKSNYIIGKSNQKFNLEPRKGLNVPGSVYSTNEQNKKYLVFLKKAKNVKFNAIGLSFVQDSKIIKIIKNLYPNKIIVSKVENSEGLKNCEQIVEASDLIMIDRGDLGAEIGNENLYNAIIKITSIANKHGKIVIMATENLQSMINNPSPYKSELVSLEFSLSLNSDFIMLSEETAISPNYLRTASWLNDFLIKKNKNKFIKKQPTSIWDNLNLSDNSTVVIFSKRGYAISKMRKVNKKLKILLFSDNYKTNEINNLRANTECILTKKFDKKNLNNFIFKNIKKYKSKIFKNSNEAILIHVVFPRKNSRANTFSLIKKDDFI